MKQVAGSHTSQVREVANQAARNPFADAIVKSNQQVAASGSVLVQHNLGKRPTGYLIIRKSAAADIYEDFSHEDQARSIKLVNPVASVIYFDVMVFP